MSSVLDMITDQLGQQPLSKLSRRINADQSTTQGAVSAALPLLLGALARNSSHHDGAASLDRALNKHDGSLLDDLTGFLDQPDVDDGNGILRHTLGARRNAVEQGVSKASGLEPNAVAQLLPILAPIVTWPRSAGGGSDKHSTQTHSRHFLATSAARWKTVHRRREC